MSIEMELASLQERVQKIEDEAAVRDVLMRYCLAADLGKAEAMRTLFDENCAVDIDGAVFMNGLSEVVASVNSDGHQGMLPNCAHVLGPILVDVEGDKAVATCYMSLMMKSEAVALARMSLGRWEFVRTRDGWRIARRIARSVGRPETGALIQEAGIGA